MERVDEPTDVVEGEDGQSFLLRGWGDLTDLGGLGDDVVVRYHDLLEDVSLHENKGGKG